MKIALVIAFSLLLFPLFAGDWPEFRGPGAQGHADGVKLPTDISAKSQHLKWKTPIPGTG